MISKPQPFCDSQHLCLKKLPFTTTKISVIFCIELKNLSVREKQIMFITSSLKVSFSEKACWGILILSPLYVYGLLLGIVEE